MAWNDFGIVIDTAQDVIHTGYHTFQGTTAAGINKRINAVEEQITDMHDIGTLKIDHRIAVGTRRRSRSEGERRLARAAQVQGGRQVQQR